MAAELLEKAKLAEQVERYEDMAEVSLYLTLKEGGGRIAHRTALGAALFWFLMFVYLKRMKDLKPC